MSSYPTPGADARIGSAEIGLNVQNSNPPTAAYVGKDDSLWVMCSSNTFAVTVTVNARYLMPSGEIKLNQYALVFASTRAGTYKQIQLPECFLLSVAAVPNLAAATNINVCVAVIVSRFAPTAFAAAQILCQGYSYQNEPISWPTGVNTTSVDCAGTIRTVIGTTPAAGADISETVPSNAKWRLLGFRAQFTTAVAAATRIPQLILDDGTNQFCVNISPSSQAASLVTSYSWAPGFTNAAVTPTAVMLMMPNPTILMPNWRFRTSTVAIQAADQWTPPVYAVEEWLLP